MEGKKKKFIIPELEIVNFQNDDIITASSAEDTSDWWREGNGDGEDF